MKKLFTLIFTGITFYCNAQNVQETLAGSIESGFSDGITGNVAKLKFPLGIAKDSNGNIYVADTGANNIKKITTDGSLVTVIAGSTGSYQNSSGNNDGIGTAARFARPGGIVVDPSGNIYVADTGNNRIRKITPSGIVSTFAGSSQGTVNGIGTAASFNSPYGLTIDTSGNIYVAESNLGTIHGNIRKITPSGLVSTFYTESLVSFQPTGVAVDAFGNIYIANCTSYILKKINSSGQLINSFNLGYSQWGITLDSIGNIFCTLRAPQSNASGIYNPITTSFTPSYPSIAKITPTGYVTIEPTDITGGFGIIIDNSNNILIADSGYEIIAKKTSPLGSTITVAGIKKGYNISCDSPPSGGPGEIAKALFDHPRGLGKDSFGNIYVADTKNNRIRKITPSGVVSTLVGSISGDVNGNASQALLSGPCGISVDANNNIYTRMSLGKIKKISLTGDVSSFPQSNPNLVIPTNYNDLAANSGIVVDLIGNVYVTSYDLIKKITPSGVVSTFAGSSSGYANGLGTAAKFNIPRGLCIDPSGNIYVADSGNNRIRKIDPNGLVTTLAPTSAILFDSPNCVGYNGGNIYVSEGNCAEICSYLFKKITASDEVYIVSQFGGGGGSICPGSNCMYVVRCNRINIVTDQTLGTNQNLFIESLIKIYPNPANDQIIIDCGSLTNINSWKYIIVNTLGQEILNGALNSQQNTVQLNNIKGQGIYFVKIYDSSNALMDTKKIIIQK